MIDVVGEVKKLVKGNGLSDLVNTAAIWPVDCADYLQEENARQSKQVL